MRRKQCPWCEEKITLNQLGSRPIQQDYKWYQFSRKEKVCPYCANPVKLGGSAIKIAYLAFPLFGLTFIELFFDYRLFDFYYLGEISWGLAIAGFFGAYWYSVFEKA